MSLHNTAALNFANDELHLFSHGYYEGAQMLSEYCVTHDSKMDYLIYPIMFLYRHYVELSCKNLLLRFYENTPSVERKTPDHDLAPLWSELIETLLQLDQRLDINTLEFQKVDTSIKKLIKTDKHSMSFRYPNNKSREPIAKPDRIDLEELRVEMNLVHAFLDYYLVVFEVEYSKNL